MSKIEWTERTWNPIVGCSVVSPGCKRCYAMRLAARLERMGLPQYAGLTRPSETGAVWTGEVRLVEDALTLPLFRRKPTTWFVNSMSDLFHESLPDEAIDRVFAVMALCPQHTLQVLTKRSARMRAYCTHRDVAHRIAMACGDLMLAGHDPRHNFERAVRHPQAADAWLDPILWNWPLPNVWLGVSVEDQRRADERRDDLRALAEVGWTTFVSYEPALGPVNWNGWEFLRWFISGGESGPDARPSHPDWHRDGRDFCAAHGIAYLFKQWGAWIVELDRDAQDPDWRADYRFRLNDDRPDITWLNRAGGRGFHGERFHVMRRVGKKVAGRHLDGIVHDGMPGTLPQGEPG